MSSLYNPDDAARLVSPWDNAFRSQRDVGLRVPLNFITAPTVSLRAACFADNVYEDRSFEKCFSNLLASGFRRFLVDVYWDEARDIWSLCPVQLSSQGAVIISQTTSQASSASATAAARDVASSSSSTLPEDRFAKWLRQEASHTSLASVTISSSGTTAGTSLQDTGGASLTTSVASSSSATPVITFPTDVGDEPLVEVGSYSCTSSMVLGYLTGIFEDWFDATSTTTDASVSFLIMNVHAAASSADPNGPAPVPNSLPSLEHQIKDVLNGNLSDRLYTPNILQDERANLNNSWYNVGSDVQPAHGFYTTGQNADGNIFTNDGWPSEAYMEFKEFYRLIAAFGSIDPQMADYDLASEQDTIFEAGYLAALHESVISASGEVASGCLFVPNKPSINVATNSSWAITDAPALDIGTVPNPNTTISSIANLTSCGLSPTLNDSLSNATADMNPAPYLAFTHSTIWSWAPGMPINASNSSTTMNRCAAMYMSTKYPGRWTTVDCMSRRPVACQDPNDPYNWTITSNSFQYEAGASACPGDYTFSVPHTALENSYLLSAISTSHTSVSTDLVYLNFNSLDVANCWASGINATCPYQPINDMNQTRVVVVPTIAAVIVFVLAALTFFVKCAANRQEDKRGRRRRNVGGWDYEGVPS